MSVNFQKEQIEEEIIYRSNLNAKPVNCHLNINYIHSLSSFRLEIISQTRLILSTQKTLLYLYIHKGIIMCACVCIYIYTHTLLYKGNTNSKMLRQEGVIQSQKRKEKKSVKAMFDTQFLCCNSLMAFIKSRKEV